MAKPTKRQVLEAVAEFLGDGPGPVETRKETLVYGDGPVRHELSIGSGGGLLGWSVEAVDVELEPLLAKDYGGFRIEIWRPDRSTVRFGVAGPALYEYPWPADRTELGASALLADVERYGRSSLTFVAGRTDLAGLLLAGTDVHRGEVWANLPAEAWPARVIKALVMARATGDAELERRALEVLDREGDRDISWEPGVRWLFREQAGVWAKAYAKATALDLSDVIPPRRRPAY
ncbi:hypothetical protein [Paractinoplanes toevensis]|uniref:Uncharacterized protein n=1 Tax=Paractinoplanes toevensis TaxID=571911 RepID=A0A919W7W2_9ACTN|nr:hypothetical protein [Actinoplanes toevensis]GIM90696.1 hypothetical protein Ato02nite_024890 [Actinoplanes toevensis]